MQLCQGVMRQHAALAVIGAQRYFRKLFQLQNIGGQKLKWAFGVLLQSADAPAMLGPKTASQLTFSGVAGKHSLPNAEFFTTATRRYGVQSSNDRTALRSFRQ